jgi:hypothetical protein
LVNISPIAFIEQDIHVIEPRHDKINIMGMQPAWIQTSLRIHYMHYGELFAISRKFYLVECMVDIQMDSS